MLWKHEECVTVRVGVAEHGRDEQEAVDSYECPRIPTFSSVLLLSGVIKAP